MQFPRKTLRNFILFGAAVALACHLAAAAAASKKVHHPLQAAKSRKGRAGARPPSRRTAKSRTPARTSRRVHSGSSHRTYAKSHKARTSRRKSPRSKVRFANIHMQPERAQQIQQALIHAGELHGQPTGRWDVETREAMKRYQQQNGFPATGVPDAKSLMKLGLGPHPLPPDADPVAQAKSFPPATPGVKSIDSGTPQDQPDN